MKTIWIAALLVLAPCAQALAWGQEGHSIVAEIAQQRLSPPAAAAIETLLGRGRSLASVASWPDDIREDHKATTQWHFVDIPIDSNQYDAATECKAERAGRLCGRRVEPPEERPAMRRQPDHPAEGVEICRAFRRRRPPAAAHRRRRPGRQPGFGGGVSQGPGMLAGLQDSAGQQFSCGLGQRSHPTRPCSTGAPMWTGSSRAG